MTTWARLLDEASRALGSRQEAKRLIEAVSGAGGAELVELLGHPAPARAAGHLAGLIERRRAGEPLQYVVGSWGFRRLDLMVDRRVLIPRPETEMVVEAALAELGRLGRDRDHSGPLLAVDLGTGSGAIALALAAEVPPSVGPVDIWATDSSAEALTVASANLVGLAGRAAIRVRLVRGDWWDALPIELAGRVDLVVSNPPYVAAEDPIEPGVAEWEPPEALWSGPSGLEATGRILSKARDWLRPNGAVVLEIASPRAAESRRLAEAEGFQVEVSADLAGRDRVLVARTGPPPAV